LAIKLNFDEGRWQEADKNWAAWWAGELDRPMVMIQTLDPTVNADPSEYNTDFMLRLPMAKYMDYYTKRLESIQYSGDSYPYWLPHYGPGIASGFLGGPVMPSAENRTVWFSVDEPIPYDKLDLSYKPDNPWWRRALDSTRAALAAWGNDVLIGTTDLGGVMDILAAFRTTNQLLLDLVDCPEEVERCCRTITQQWLRYYREAYDIARGTGRGTTFWAPMLCKSSGYMLQNDFSAMISPRMFERFDLDNLTTLCNSLDHAFYHLDGPNAVRHLDMLLSIKSLKGVQWIPGSGNPGHHNWLPLLKRIRDAGKLCQIYVSARNALLIDKEIGSKGFVFYIVPEEPFTKDGVNEYLEVIMDPAPFLKKLLRGR
jgi:5-methyltetrahydrofolate--homocysteine methyltransferase